MRLTVRTSRSEAQQWGEINVHTYYEQLSIPVHFKVAQGKLEIGPDRLVFDQCFPVSFASRSFKKNLLKYKSPNFLTRVKFVHIH